MKGIGGGMLAVVLLAAAGAGAAPVERHAFFGELHLHTTFSLDSYYLLFLDHES